MNLLVVTQKVDRNDENLGAFSYWWEEMAKRMDRVIIIASAVGETGFGPGVEVYSLGKERGAGKFRRIMRFFSLVRRHAKRSDAIFFHMIPEFAIAAAPFYLLSRRTSCLWYAHGKVTNALRIAERLVDYVCTSSASGFRLPSKKVIYTGQAIDTELFRPAASSHANGTLLSMITVGRISPVKGYKIIIEACSLLEKENFSNWTLTIVGGALRLGDQEYLTMLNAMVERYGLNSRIHFTGPRPYKDIPGLLAQHDLFLNMSATGSLDKAVLEAMASGLNVLTANEAYRPILPDRYVLVNVEPIELAERIKELEHESCPNLALRQIVVEHHNLTRTIGIICEALLQPRWR